VQYTLLNDKHAPVKILMFKSYSCLSDGHLIMHLGLSLLDSLDFSKRQKKKVMKGKRMLSKKLKIIVTSIIQ